MFDSLADFRTIADTLHARPTRFRDLVPVGNPAAIGACDAYQRGMGGVWFLPDSAPIVWRSEFPIVIQRSMATSNNRAGAISISDLELAGTIAHKQVLVQAVHTVAERPIWLAGDNRASLSWATKGSATSTSARAYLLRLNALHQRRHRYVPFHDHIAGKANVMADDASRLWHLSDADLLSHFCTVYPQATSWRLLTLQADMRLALIGSLSRKRCIPPTLCIATTPPLARGRSGATTVPPAASVRISKTLRATRSPFSSSLRSSTAPAASHPATGPSDLARWRTPYATWRRRLPGWGPQTLA